MTAIHQIAVIFIAILVGFGCRKLKVITEEGTSVLSNTVIKVILPFYLFDAIVSSESGIDSAGVLAALGISTGMFLVAGLVALIVIPRLKPAPDDRGIYMFETMCGNVTYIGIPVCAAAFGGNAAFYASLLNIPYNLLCFSLGIFLLSGKASFKRILNPAFLSGLVAAILYMLGVKVPVLITDACNFIGKATSPCAMLIIGSVLADVPVKDLFTDWRMIPFTVVKLFGVAALMLLLLRFVRCDDTLRKVVILMAAMPAATNSTMLCAVYGGNRSLSAKLIFITTALAVLTIPLWVQILS